MRKKLLATVFITGKSCYLTLFTLIQVFYHVYREIFNVRGVFTEYNTLTRNLFEDLSVR